MKSSKILIVLVMVCSLLLTGCKSDTATDSAVKLGDISEYNSNAAVTKDQDKNAEGTGKTDESSQSSDDRNNSQIPDGQNTDQSSAGQNGNQSPDEQGNSQTSEPEIKLIITLDPGHGGCFAGAAWYNRVEKNMTLEVGLKVKQYLEENYRGVEVHMTREKDITLSEDIVADLEMRCQLAKENNSDVLVSLHFNACDKHDANGSTVLISRRDNVHEESDGLAQCILEKLVGLGFKNNGATMRKSSDKVDEKGDALDYYAINRHCANRDIPGIIIEHCYMDNDKDVEFLNKENALDLLAKADAEGIAQYYQLEKR